MFLNERFRPLISVALICMLTTAMIGCDEAGSAESIVVDEESLNLLEISATAVTLTNVNSDQFLSAELAISNDSDAESIFDPETGEFNSDEVIPAPKQPFPDVPEEGSYAPTPVFPGAEGFGSYTPAGRLGGQCTVSNLNDSGDGSLRYCVEAKGSKTVQFSVAGKIVLQSTLTINQPFISILGQSAPDPGIMLTLEPKIDGPVVAIKTHDVLMQHMRIRAGASDAPSCCRDAVSIGSEVPGQVHNIVLDHNSLSWAIDEVVEIWFDSHDITLSRNIISEALHRSTHEIGPAGRGLLVGANAHSISIHHNLFAHNYERNPSITSTGVTDVVNNIIYHWVSRGAQISTVRGDNYVNLVKNVFIAHPEGHRQPSSTKWFDVSLDGSKGHDLKVYFDGNFGYWRSTDADEQWSLAGTDWQTQYNPSRGWHTDTRHEAPAVTEFPVEQLENVIGNDVGATLPIQDSVDTRVLEELKWRSGYMPDCVTGCELNARGWPDMNP